MNEAPRVLVVAKWFDLETARSISENLARQTYREIKLVFIRSAREQSVGQSMDDFTVCDGGNFARLVEKSETSRVLFLPESLKLKPAALEKLVISLELAPDQQGVADCERGCTGLWLARRSAKMDLLINLWPVSQLKWIEACQREKPALFYIEENLLETEAGIEVERPYVVASYFGKLPLEFENLQAVTTAPLWSAPELAPDEHSVLFLVSSLPMGGACKFILDVAGQLKAQGFRVTVATTAYDIHNPNPWLGELLRVIPDVFVLSHARPVELPRQIVHLCRTRRCARVVLSHCMLGYQLLPWLRTELPEVSFVDYTHIEYETEWPEGGYALRSVHSQSLLDLSLVSSEHLRHWMVERGAAADAVHVCHTNIDGEKWKPQPETRTQERNALGVDDDTSVILYPCRLAEQKRPELLCNIVAELHRVTSTPFLVVVAGDGPLMGALKNFVAKQGLEDSFAILGAVSLERVARLHNASDIFLLPSLIEGIALALFEAMALESVPVVSDVGGQRELVTPECGHLIPLGEPARELRSYVSTLKQLMENTELRRKQGQACRARVTAHFGLETMTQNFMAALKKAGVRRTVRQVGLPAPAVCCEIAALAVDQIRLNHEGLVMREMGNLLAERVHKQELMIAKLKRQIETARVTNRNRENMKFPADGAKPSPASTHLVIWHTEGTAISGLLSWMWRLKASLPKAGIRLTLASLEIQSFRFLQVCDPEKVYDVRVRTSQEFIAFLKENRSAIHLINHAYEYVDLLEQIHPSLLRRLKLVGICHTDQDFYYRNLERIDDYLCGVVAVSPQCREKLEHLLPHRQGAIPVLPDWDMPCAPRPAAHGPDGRQPLRVMFNGRLLHLQKRVLDLPKISRTLAAGNAPVELTIVGDGPDLPSLREEFKIGAHVPCRLVGPKAPWEMKPLLEAHDVFLQVSEFEGASVSLMEAMVAGLVPVVTRTESGADLLLHGRNALLSPVGDVKSIAAALASLAAQRERLVPLSCAAFETARAYLEKLNYAGRLKDYLETLQSEPAAPALATAT